MELIYVIGAGCGKWNLKNQNLCKIFGISIKDTFCSSLFLYNFETYQKLPYKINLPGYKLYPFSCTSQYLRIIYWAFTDPQKPRLFEIDPKIWKFWHYQTPKMTVFEPKNPTVQRSKCFSNAMNMRNYKLWLTLLHIVNMCVLCQIWMYVSHILSMLVTLRAC